MPGLIDGEKRNISSYTDTLEAHELGADTRLLLETQRDRIGAAIAMMEQIKSNSTDHSRDAVLID